MPTEKEVVETLKEIIDPHSNTSVYEMCLISDLKVTPKSVSLTFRPTSAHCPLGLHLAANMKRRLKKLQGAEKVDIKVVGHIHEKLINDQLASM